MRGGLETASRMASNGMVCPRPSPHCFSSWPLNGLIIALSDEGEQVLAKAQRHVLFLFGPLLLKSVRKRGRAAAVGSPSANLAAALVNRVC